MNDNLFPSFQVHRSFLVQGNSPPSLQKSSPFSTASSYIQKTQCIKIALKNGGIARIPAPEVFIDKFWSSDLQRTFVLKVIAPKQASHHVKIKAQDFIQAIGMNKQEAKQFIAAIDSGQPRRIQVLMDRALNAYTKHQASSEIFQAKLISKRNSKAAKTCYKMFFILSLLGTAAGCGLIAHYTSSHHYQPNRQGVLNPGSIAKEPNAATPFNKLYETLQLKIAQEPQRQPSPSRSSYRSSFEHGKVCEGVFYGDRLAYTECSYPNGDRYKGMFDVLSGDLTGKGIFFKADGEQDRGYFIHGRLSGKGSRIFANANRYEGQFVDGKRHGPGVLFLANEGAISHYESNHYQDVPIGIGRKCFHNGNSYEAKMEYNGFQGKGRFSNLGENLDLSFYNDYPLGDVSHLGSSLFLHLLLQRNVSSEAILSLSFPAGIMVDYLAKKGYLALSEELGAALLIYFTMANYDQRNGVKQRMFSALVQRLQNVNQPVLLPLLTGGHAMGLKITQVVKGFIDLEVYNSGAGLYFHEQHPYLRDTFQTAFKRRIPLEVLNEDLIDSFMSDRGIADIYHTISTIPGVRDIFRGVRDIFDPSVIWQRQQQADNCSLMWILAYLENTMGSVAYEKLLVQLFTDAADAAEQMANPNAEMIAALREEVRSMLTPLNIKIV